MGERGNPLVGMGHILMQLSTATVNLDEAAAVRGRGRRGLMAVGRDGAGAGCCSRWICLIVTRCAYNMNPRWHRLSLLSAAGTGVAWLVPSVEAWAGQEESGRGGIDSRHVPPSRG